MSLWSLRMNCIHMLEQKKSNIKTVWKTKTTNKQKQNEKKQNKETKNKQNKKGKRQPGQHESLFLLVFESKTESNIWRLKFECFWPCEEFERIFSHVWRIHFYEMHGSAYLYYNTRVWRYRFSIFGPVDVNRQVSTAYRAGHCHSVSLFSSRYSEFVNYWGLWRQNNTTDTTHLMHVVSRQVNSSTTEGKQIQQQQLQ